MNDELYDPHKSLGFMTITANRKMSAFLHRKMKKAGIDLSTESWGILVQIWSRESLNQDELARVACVDESTMSRALSLMERKGLIVRKVDPTNTRRKILRSTPKANKLRERSMAVEREMRGLILENINLKDLNTAIKVLATIKDNISKHDM